MDFSDITQYFLYIPGIVVFLVGSGQMRKWLRFKRPGVCVEGRVVSAEHVQKRDGKGRTEYDFYNVTVEYTNPDTHHTERQAVKSATEYAAGQQVLVYRGRGGEQTTLADAEADVLFPPLAVMLGGALLIIMALEQLRGSEYLAMLSLAVFMAGAGAFMVINYVTLKRRGLVPIAATISEVYSRQISKETKILRGSRYTYYPVVRFNLDGRENILRLKQNATGEKAYIVGETIEIYYDPAKRIVTERAAKPAVLVGGVILLALGVLSVASILPVVLG